MQTLPMSTTTPIAYRIILLSPVSRELDVRVQAHKNDATKAVLKCPSESGAETLAQFAGESLGATAHFKGANFWITICDKAALQKAICAYIAQMAHIPTPIGTPDAEAVYGEEV